MRSAPYPVFTSADPSNYNLKWGRIIGRLHGSSAFELNDNINLADRGAEGDFSIGPTVGIGFLWPLSSANVMNFDLDFGYRWYVDHPDLNSFSILPNSRWDFRVFTPAAQFNIFNAINLQVDPVARGEISGSEGSLINFRMINNTSGVQTDWAFSPKLGTTAAYSFSIARSLSDQFRTLDRNEHSLSIGPYYRLSHNVTVGVSAAGTFSDYVEPFHNDARSYTVSSFAKYRMTRFITIDAALGYTISDFNRAGTVGDTSEFAGTTFQFALNHRMNSRVTQNLGASRSANLGLGSNFTDVWAAQYGIAMRLRSNLSINSTISGEHLEVSNVGGEQADRLLWYIGTGFQVARTWKIGLAYAYALKDSDLQDRDYQQNRLTLNVTKQF